MGWVVYLFRGGNAVGGGGAEGQLLDAASVVLNANGAGAGGGAPGEDGPEDGGIEGV